MPPASVVKQWHSSCGKKWHFCTIDNKYGATSTPQDGNNTAVPQPLPKLLPLTPKQFVSLALWGLPLPENPQGLPTPPLQTPPPSNLVPLAPVMQYVGELAVDELRLLVAPGTGEFTLYEDDGTSFDYRQELYVTTTYRVYQQGAEVVVEVIPRQGEWVPNPRKVIVAVIGKGEQEFVDEGMGKTLVF